MGKSIEQTMLHLIGFCIPKKPINFKFVRQSLYQPLHLPHSQQKGYNQGGYASLLGNKLEKLLAYVAIRILCYVLG